MTAPEDDRHKGGGLPRAAAIEQLNAFGVEPGAADVGPATRTTDPATSRAGALRAADGLTMKQLAVLDAFQPFAQPLTHELLISRYAARRARLASAEWYPALTDSSIRTRCKELETLGYVTHVDDSGTTSTGGKCGRWAASWRGRAVDIRGIRAERAPRK